MMPTPKEGNTNTVAPSTHTPSTYYVKEGEIRVARVGLPISSLPRHCRDIVKYNKVTTVNFSETIIGELKP